MGTAVGVAVEAVEILYILIIHRQTIFAGAPSNPDQKNHR
jgi:hypothetical protein